MLVNCHSLINIYLANFNGAVLLQICSVPIAEAIGGAEEDRTLDFLLAKQALYQTELRPHRGYGGPEGNRTTDLVLIRDAL